MAESASMFFFKRFEMMREDMGILLYPEHNMYISFLESKKGIIAYAKSSRT